MFIRCKIIFTVFHLVEFWIGGVMRRTCRQSPYSRINELVIRIWISYVS